MGELTYGDNCTLYLENCLLLQPYPVGTSFVASNRAQIRVGGAALSQKDLPYLLCLTWTQKQPRY